MSNLQDSKLTGRLKVMGDIGLYEDGDEVPYKNALLIQFDSEDECRAAIQAMACKFNQSEE